MTVLGWVLVFVGTLTGVVAGGFVGIVVGVDLRRAMEDL